MAGNLSKLAKAQKSQKADKDEIVAAKESNYSARAPTAEPSGFKDAPAESESNADGQSSMINYVDPMIVKLKEANVMHSRCIIRLRLTILPRLIHRMSRKCTR